MTEGEDPAAATGDGRVTPAAQSGRDVSVIIPCRNEAATIRSALEGVLAQKAAGKSLELIVADGMSSDGTRSIVLAFSAEHPELPLRLLDNPARTIPSALNRAIEASHGQVIIRLDAHAIPAPDYIERCLAVLRKTNAANVGGQWEIRPSRPGPVGRAIAEAGSHLLGAGDARYRTGGRAGPVETVPFGAFPRAWLDRMGGYDETLLTNEDYELNLRLRRAGGVVWFDPLIRSAYFARPDLIGLARQYLRYGFWKARMLTRNPESLRWRQTAAPMFVALTAVLAALSIWFPPCRALLGLQWGAYAVALALSGVERAIRRRDPHLVWGLPAALLVIHMAWGGGSWWGLLTAVFENRREFTRTAP
jgi:cellulose synthase/poly-beta-1,6-N-acetylglucosamine synthase-like glycosyltransferase